jgi:hypothetical protein
MRNLTFEGQGLLVINVPNNSYRESLVKNPELKRRYGYLEIASRETGLDTTYHIPNIEKYEIEGVYYHNNFGPMVDFLRQSGCFEDSQKVIVLKCVN